MEFLSKRLAGAGLFPYNYEVVYNLKEGKKHG